MRDLDLHDGTASDMTRADHPQNEGEARLRGSGSGENAGATPAIQIRFSRFSGTVQLGPVQRQETQIVQSCMTLDDFLP